MNKLTCSSQNAGAKTLSADACIFGRFRRFSPAVSIHLTADLTPEWSGGSIVHLLLHIYVKNSYFCAETAANSTLNDRRLVVFDWLWANTAPTLNTVLSLKIVHAKWWIHCLLIYLTPLLFHVTSICDRPKLVCRIVLVFFTTTAEFGRPQRLAFFVSVRLRLKSTYHFLNVISD